MGLESIVRQVQCQETEALMQGNGPTVAGGTLVPNPLQKVL